MELIEIFGYIGALFIGLVLGLIGGGGSILTVPILVYALSFNPVIATAYSLFVVGTTSLVGAIKNMMKGRVDFKTAIVFAIPAFIAVYITRAFIIPSIPEYIFEFNGYVVTKNLAIMLFFAFIMLLASLKMIRSGRKQLESEKVAVKSKNILLMIQGFFIGLITGTCWRWRRIFNYSCFGAISETTHEKGSCYISIYNRYKFFDRIFRRCTNS